ncbi:MAG: hypothetical protein R2683_03600 [Bifidobacterium adolescentis]
MLDMLAWATGPSDHGVTAIRMPGEQILAMERSADMAFDLPNVPPRTNDASILPAIALSRGTRIVRPGM